MTTTLMPVDPAVTAQRVNRVLTISASLLPDEIVAKRRNRRIRGLMIAFVLLVALACSAWIVQAKRLEQEADREVTAANGQIAALQREKNKFAPVVKLRDEGDLLKKQLQTVMANDLDWSALLHLLRTTGPDDIVVDGISGSLAKEGDSEGATTSGTLPSTSKSGSLGTVTVTGTAPDKKTLAAYVDALAEKTTVGNPFVTSVTRVDTKSDDETSGEETNGEETSDDETTLVEFSVDVEITKAALCGRFSSKSCGGK
ncbi:PilN domain-containing protein [Couchioplanes caeruleus]|uniref:Fimbrial assembly protein PilN n=2 Tax=Couchioplanes caeruleus TaxID=56438 RepID=A0A1K0FT90_9ACTN|nr:hypothetical protein [Couchioplanes caeruleus]OJF16071.1 hypothetical protein BG844_00945 [Couchioplanes caeruleus subsp. caeruleus]ROP29960.1 fimbrial assembly protein PilN [Couchioplanes caeruleus]